MAGRKRKKKQQQQQPAFFSKPRFNNKSLLPTPVSTPGSTAGSTGVFQAPHHQQESMVELSDDTSPNIPNPVGAWKPVTGGNAATPSTSAPAPKPLIKPTLAANWQRFQASLKAKPGLKAPSGLQIKKSEDIFDEPKQDTKEGIFCEDVDVKEVASSKPTAPLLPTPAGPPKVQKPDIVQGTASEIKISFKNNEKALAVDKTNTSKTEGNDKTATPTEQGSMPSKDERQMEAQNLPDTNVNTQIKRDVLQMLLASGNYPAGVPRSFLMKQPVLGALQPQEHHGPSPPPNQVTWSNLQPLYDELLKSKSDGPPDEPRRYSPSDSYEDVLPTETDADGSESVDGQSGQKRQSAFDRLGPMSEPKKPKLTINLLCSKDESVREVLDTTEQEEKYIPVWERKDVIDSEDATVMKYLSYWPWKRNIATRKSVTARVSKTVMILEQEQMEEAYEKDNAFIMVSVKGYPPHWKKEQVLDAVLEAVRGKSFIPCFTEFTREECKFLVLRSRAALVSIHRMGFYIRQADVELVISITLTVKSLKDIDFIPRLVLRKQLAYGYDGERKLSLKEFTLRNDISHFIYFPLNRLYNQTELAQLQSTVAWAFLTDLDLSYNRLTNIDGFELHKTTPKLKHLDLSYNSFERLPALLRCREVALRSLKLEGNPLCHDYIDPAHYVRVVKMIFPALVELDGVKITLKGDLPASKRNFCPPEAEEVANKFLEVFFPLLEAKYEDKVRIQQLYHGSAVLSITYRHSLRYSSLHRKFRKMFHRARSFDEGEVEAVRGAQAIARHVADWPALVHDPTTFNVDVMVHNEGSTILRIGGVLKLTSETLAEDEHLLAFTRTLVLTTKNGAEYKIRNEMVFWDEPYKELANISFQFNPVKPRGLSLKLDSIPNDELKEKLVDIFMKISEAEKVISERCLERREWDLRSALEYYMRLVKLNEVDDLRKEVSET